MALPIAPSTGNSTVDAVLYLISAGGAGCFFGWLAMKKQLSNINRLISGDNLEIKANSSIATLIATLQQQSAVNLEQLNTTLDRVNGLAKEREDAVNGRIECERLRGDEKIAYEHRIAILIDRHSRQVKAFEETILKMAIRLKHLEALSEWNARMAEFYLRNYPPDARENMPHPPSDLRDGPKFGTLDDVLENAKKDWLDFDARFDSSSDESEQTPGEVR